MPQLKSDILGLNDEYTIQASYEANSCVTLNLYHHHEKVNSVSLHDHQCSKFSSRFCETSLELYQLLIDLSMDNTTVNYVWVFHSRQLVISFPICYGNRKCQKIWSISIDFPDVCSTDKNEKEEISLDPVDWNDARLLSHRVMEDMIEYLRNVRSRPVWQPMPLKIKQEFAESNIPWEGASPFKVYEQVCSLIMAYPFGNIHPRFWGYVAGTGSLIGVLAELITATMNPVAWGGQQASVYVERQVLTWLKTLMGFPNDDTSSGALLSGTSVATIIALAVARNKFCGQQMKIYCSTEAHSCLFRAAQLLGIGQENVVLIATNNEKQIDLEILKVTIDSKCCAFVVGSAGTASSGVIDDLQGLADLCACNPSKFWYHIDGAIGAVACCSARLRPLFTGIERADSIAFDLHKWLFVPYECGCILIRDGRLHRATFSQPAASYLTKLDGGIFPTEGEPCQSDYVLELSRSMKSLKVWMTFKTYGIQTLGQIMEQNVDQANTLLIW